MHRNLFEHQFIQYWYWYIFHETLRTIKHLTLITPLFHVHICIDCWWWVPPLVFESHRKMDSLISKTNYSLIMRYLNWFYLWWVFDLDQMELWQTSWWAKVQVMKQRKALLRASCLSNFELFCLLWNSRMSLFRKVLSHFSPVMLLITISLELLAAGSSLYNSCLLLVTTEQLHMSSWRLSTSLMGMLVEVIEKEKRTLVIHVSRRKATMTLQLFLFLHHLVPFDPPWRQQPHMQKEQ